MGYDRFFKDNENLATKPIKHEGHIAASFLKGRARLIAIVI
ncbi:uncharacterized protein G2W53_043738 [Senna tora]|uniref:Uncharacterized protein n=1 Tax=Senna tora TaxID=362788 RepID=A0A834SJA1_9FABA|nr:uncharacterized protein G2W53_043738 [Senna tora]